MGDDGTHNYLVFQPVNKYFKIVNNEICSWESKGLFNEKITSIITSSYIFASKLAYHIRFWGGFLKQDEVTYTHEAILNIYIVYKLSPFTNTSRVTLENCLFGAFKLIKNDDIDKYKYSGYGIGFNSRGTFHIQVMNVVEMLLSFGLI